MNVRPTHIAIYSVWPVDYNTPVYNQASILTHHVTARRKFYLSNLTVTRVAGKEVFDIYKKNYCEDTVKVQKEQGICDSASDVSARNIYLTLQERAKEAQKWFVVNSDLIDEIATSEITEEGFSDFEGRGIIRRENPLYYGAPCYRDVYGNVHLPTSYLQSYWPSEENVYKVPDAGLVSIARQETVIAQGIIQPSNGQTRDEDIQRYTRIFTQVLYLVKTLGQVPFGLLLIALASTTDIPTVLHYIPSVTEANTLLQGFRINKDFGYTVEDVFRAIVVFLRHEHLGRLSFVESNSDTLGFLYYAEIYGARESLNRYSNCDLTGQVHTEFLIKFWEDFWECVEDSVNTEHSDVATTLGAYFGYVLHITKGEAEETWFAQKVDDGVTQVRRDDQEDFISDLSALAQLLKKKQWTEETIVKTNNIF